MDDNIIKCPKCGHDNDSSSEECNNCGVTLSLVLGGNKKNKPQSQPKASESPEPEKIQNCPKCGHAVTGAAAECIKCGIIFSKYFRVQERMLKESQDDIEIPALEEAPKDDPEQKEKAEKDAAETERRKAAARKEKKARLKLEKEELLKKQQEENARAVALKNARDEKNTAAAPVEEPVEQDDTTGPDKAEKERLAQLEKEAESLRTQADALKKEKQEHEKAEIVRKAEQEQERQDVLQKAQETQARITALENETLALKKEKEALEAAETQRKEQDRQEADARMQAEKEEQEKAETLRKEREDTRKRTETILKSVVPKPTMKELLKKYEGEAIGINFDDPAEIRSARLAKVNEDHFSILVPENELVHSYPYSDIVSIVEGAEGVPIDASGETPTFPVVIRIFHLMVKKKWGFI